MAKAAIKRDRPQRRSTGSGRPDILTVKGKEPGFEYRWVNGDVDRIEQMIEKGWEHVEHTVNVGSRTTEQGGTIGSVVSRKVGLGREDFLMRIPEDWYKEDQALKQQEGPDQIDAAIKGKTKVQGHYGSVTTEVKTGVKDGD